MFRNIALVCSDCPTARVFYNYFPEIRTVVMERPQSRKSLIRGRIKRLGLARVTGQLAFQSLIPPLLRRLSRARIQQLQQQYALNCDSIPEQKLHRLDSVNLPECGKTLAAHQPDLILVHGTRIISAATLAQVNCPWVNIHAGITPAYRGTHGAYWALYHRDLVNCGVTVHLVDQGIDTGSILAQKRIEPQRGDNFVTYPWIQLGEGLRLLQQLLTDWPQPTRSEGRSALYHHPTIGQYLSGCARGVF